MGTMGWSAARGAAKITTAYILLGAGWILFSDWAFGLVYQNSRNLMVVQMGKGLVFVVLSGLLIFALVRQEERRLASTNDDLEQTLLHATVLHRLLRHNLRNSCDVIQNNVDLLQSGRGDEADNRERIQRQASKLSTIASKSQHLRDVVFDDGMEPVELDLLTVVEEAIADARAEYPDATIVLESTASQQVVAHPRLSVAICELLANAVVHQEGEASKVSVSFERDGDEAVLRVTDDGPGIPEIERTVLEAGVEDALTHSRGIGLWVVRFIVAASGGSLTVPSTGSDGSVVSIRLPVAGK